MDIQKTYGWLGKSLDNVVNLEVKKTFPQIKMGPPPIDLDEEVIQDLSTDQKYGYRMVLAIRSGSLPTDLANMDIGPLRLTMMTMFWMG